MDVDDEISNLVDLHMGMFDGGWKWQDLQGLLWLDHHKRVASIFFPFSIPVLLDIRWRYLNEAGALWRKVISKIHGSDGGFETIIGSGQKASVWANIIGCCSELNQMGISLSNLMVKKVSSGNQTRFWDDAWIKDIGPLKFRFPRLFALEMNTNCLVADDGLYLMAFGKVCGLGEDSLVVAHWMNFLCYPLLSVGWFLTCLVEIFGPGPWMNQVVSR
ncbi:hypothetical protein Tco_0032250 [Tanacetum coccineum]